MPSTRTSYGQDGAVNTVMTREPLDIGPLPDFWGDFKKMRQTAPAAAPARGARGGTALANPERPLRPPPGPIQAPSYAGMTPRMFSQISMSPQGTMGHYVNPLDVPIALQGKIPTGFFTDSALSNYSYSPTVSPDHYANPFQPSQWKQ